MQATPFWRRRCMTQGEMHVLCFLLTDSAVSLTFLVWSAGGAVWTTSDLSGSDSTKYRGKHGHTLVLSGFLIVFLTLFSTFVHYYPLHLSSVAVAPSAAGSGAGLQWRNWQWRRRRRERWEGWEIDRLGQTGLFTVQEAIPKQGGPHQAPTALWTSQGSLICKQW